MLKHKMILRHKIEKLQYNILHPKNCMIIYSDNHNQSNKVYCKNLWTLKETIIVFLNIKKATI